MGVWIRSHPDKTASTVQLFFEPQFLSMLAWDRGEHYSWGMGITKATHDTDRRQIAKFEEIINVGPSIADDFRLLGFQSPSQLIGQDPVQLYQKLCKLTRVRQDPCVLDVLIATVDFMNGQPPRPWWEYTAQRKERYHDVYSVDAHRPSGSTPR